MEWADLSGVVTYILGFYSFKVRFDFFLFRRGHLVPEGDGRGREEGSRGSVQNGHRLSSHCAEMCVHP